VIISIIIKSVLSRFSVSIDEYSSSLPFSLSPSVSICSFQVATEMNRAKVSSPRHERTDINPLSLKRPVKPRRNRRDELVRLIMRAIT